jgi:hypothetical protein
MIFEQAWLVAFKRHWNTDFTAQHHRFDKVGTVAIRVTDAYAPAGCWLAWDRSGVLAEARTLAPDDNLAKVPCFSGKLVTWREYSTQGKSAAYYFAMGEMAYTGDPWFFLRRGLLFDVVARCAGGVEGI